MATYTINGYQYTQDKLSLMKIIPLALLLKGIPVNITTTEQAIEALGTYLPDAMVLVLKPVGDGQISVAEMQAVDLDTAAQMLEDFLELNNIEAVIDRLSALFTRLVALITKLKSLFGV